MREAGGRGPTRAVFACGACPPKPWRQPVMQCGAVLINICQGRDLWNPDFAIIRGFVPFADV
jgi:hypothetical protein